MNIGWGLSLGALNSEGIESSDRARYSRLSTSCRIKSFPSAAIRSSKGAGKKQGVSETRNPIGTPHRSASRVKSFGYCSCLNFELKACRREGIMTGKCSAGALAREPITECSAATSLKRENCLYPRTINDCEQTPGN